MAVFGTIDAATFANNVAVTNGDATVTKNAADTVEQGDVLVLGGVNYIVRSVTSTTTIELHTTYAGSTNAALAGAVRRTPPKSVAEYVIKGGDSNVGEILFVDATEVGLAENKSRGLNGPGWWNYKTYTDHSGATRHKAEHLAFVYIAAGTSGDFTDDTKVADVTSTITISAQPADIGDGATTLEVPAAAQTFSVTAAASTGTLVYQWQRRTSSTGRWVNIGATTDSSAYTGHAGATLTVVVAALTDLTLNGYQYRVKLTSSAGAKEVISDVATLNLVDEV